MAPPPPPLLFPRLLSLEVRGGYFDGLHVAFASHVTCIFGGKGSGKTTLFEILRFGLFGSILARSDTVRSLLRKNFGTGSVRVTFETKHGVRYVAERGLKDEQPRFFTEEGAPAKLAPDAFPIEAYGQDEIENVGANRESQRELLDRLAGEEVRPVLAEIAQVTERLEARVDGPVGVERPSGACRTHRFRHAQLGYSWAVTPTNLVRLPSGVSSTRSSRGNPPHRKQRRR